jgi:hypothetical protein
MSSQSQQATFNALVQEAHALAKRALSEDRPELIKHAHELVTLASRMAQALETPLNIDPDAFAVELKKRFLLSTSLKIVGGIFPDEAVASPIDPTPLRRNSTYRLGVGLIDHRREKVAIDAPCYQPDNQCFGFVVPDDPVDEWYIARDQGDVSFVASLEHEWIRNSGAELVVVREVIGLGRDAIMMAEETRPGIRDWIDRAQTTFEYRYVSLSFNLSGQGVPGFYHFGKGGFCRHPWDEVER